MSYDRDKNWPIVKAMQIYSNSDETIIGHTTPHKATKATLVLTKLQTAVKTTIGNKI